MRLKNKSKKKGIQNFVIRDIALSSFLHMYGGASVKKGEASSLGGGEGVCFSLAVYICVNRGAEVCELRDTLAIHPIRMPAP